jgi:hypothetical protein
VGGVHTTPGDLLAGRSALRWRTLGCGNSSRLIHRDVCQVEFPKTAAFSASPRRSLHRYVDHPGSKVADSQSGLSAHQSLLTPRCPFMRSMHQLCWPVNNSANGYSFRPYRGGWRSLAKPVALAHRTGGNPPNRWRICRVHLGERHGRSVDELGKHGHPTCSTSNMGRSCGRGRSSGTELGARRLKGRTMRFILAAILALSGLKLIVL